MFKVNTKDTRATPLVHKCQLGCRPIHIDPIWYLFKYFLVIFYSICHYSKGIQVIYYHLPLASSPLGSVTPDILELTEVVSLSPPSSLEMSSSTKILKYFKYKYAYSKLFYFKFAHAYPHIHICHNVSNISRVRNGYMGNKRSPPYFASNNKRI